MKNKFNVGDRVMIRTDLELGEEYGELTLLDSMAEHCGTISEIAYIRARVNSSCCYILKGVGPSFGLPWLWSEEMLAGPVKYLCDVKIEKASKDSAISGLKVEKASKKPKFNTGDKVRIKADLKVGERYGGLKYFEGMARHAGKCYEVLYYSTDIPVTYVLKDCQGFGDSYWVWAEAMLEKVKEDESYIKPQEFDDDDYVYVLDKFGRISYKSVYSIVHEDRFAEHLFKNATINNRCFSNVKAITAYQHWTQLIADICRFKQEKDASFISNKWNPGYVIDFLPTAGGFGAHVLRSPCIWVPTFSTFNLADECANWINNKYNL